MVGAAIYVLRGFDAAGLLGLIETERITQVFGLPMMYRALLDHPSFGGLTHIGAVGTPLTGVRVAIMGPDGALLPAGQRGERRVDRGGEGRLRGRAAGGRGRGGRPAARAVERGDHGDRRPRPSETIDEAELIGAPRQRLDGFKVPKAVIVTDALPKTSTGKIQKNVLRDRHAGHYTALPAVGP